MKNRTWMRIPIFFGILAGCLIFTLMNAYVQVKKQENIVAEKPTQLTNTTVPKSTFANLSYLADQYHTKSLATNQGLSLSILDENIIYVTSENTRENKAISGGSAQYVSVEKCGFTIKQAVELAQKIGTERNIPWNYFGPLLLSESSFKQWILVNGNCKTHTSYINGREIAYGLGQIYYDVHKRSDGSFIYDLDKIKNNPEYNLQASADILLMFYRVTGDWDEAVAEYKGVTTSDNNYLIFKACKDKGFFVADGETIYFTENYNPPSN